MHSQGLIFDLNLNGFETDVLSFGVIVAHVGFSREREKDHKGKWEAWACSRQPAGLSWKLQEALPVPEICRLRGNVNESRENLVLPAERETVVHIPEIQQFSGMGRRALRKEMEDEREEEKPAFTSIIRR